MIVHAGYSAAFLTLAACAAAGALLFLLAMPETMSARRYEPGKTDNERDATVKNAALLGLAPRSVKG